MAWRTTLERGEAVLIDDHVLRFVKVMSNGLELFELDGDDVVLEPYDMTRLLPDVAVWTSPGDRGWGKTNINISAPKRVKLTREDQHDDT